MWTSLKQNYYIRRIIPFVLAYILLEVIASSVILFMDAGHISWDFFSIVKMLFDKGLETFVSLLYFLIPFFAYLLILPRKLHRSRLDRIVTLVFFTLFVGVCAFEDMASILFWDEFGCAFNFIAVDYLIYTKEVIGNIRQSYPVAFIILGVVGLALGATWFFRKRLFPDPEISVPSFGLRAAYLGGLIACCVTSFFLVDIGDAESGQNRFNNEFSKDGFYSLFSAFLKNELEYDQFYRSCSQEDAAAFLRKDLAQDDAVFLDEKNDSIARKITPSTPEIKANIMVVIMESMGSEFLNEKRTDGANVTPCLSGLAKQGLFFPNTYATGTRSVRGLEAVSTSMVPLPGMSIVRREGNDHLQTIGSIFSEKGYETKWIYGGYGLFDNMNNFYRNNGFEIVDRTNMNSDEITFTTVWGVCDGDLFKRAIKESDKSHAAGKPFLNVVFTTSNHRPYAYPDGKIDIPSKTGRLGAVKYSDYAVGELVKEAKTKPWFDNTVFLFIADHGAGSAGRKELNPETHLIPLIIYAPKLIAPERHDYAISQIDALPTLLGALNTPYTASFYGRDARKPGYHSRYFISNYQYIGYCKDDVMVVQKPVRQVSYYQNDKETPETDALKKYLDESIKYYEHASKWRKYIKQQ